MENKPSKRKRTRVSCQPNLTAPNYELNVLQTNRLPEQPTQIIQPLIGFLHTSPVSRDEYKSGAFNGSQQMPSYAQGQHLLLARNSQVKTDFSRLPHEQYRHPGSESPHIDSDTNLVASCNIQGRALVDRQETILPSATRATQVNINAYNTRGQSLQASSSLLRQSSGHFRVIQPTEKQPGDVQGLPPMGTQQKTRERTAQACDACRVSKVKCSDLKPCSGCRRRGIRCSYPLPVPNRRDTANFVVLSQLATLAYGQEKVLQRQETLELALSKCYPNLANGLGNEPCSQDRDRTADGHYLGLDLNSFPPVDRAYTPPRGHAEVGSGARSAPHILADQVSIPIGHSAGTSRVLQWKAIRRLVADKLVQDKSSGDPFQQESSRTPVGLYGRTEDEEIQDRLNEHKERVESICSRDVHDSGPSSTAFLRGVPVRPCRVDFVQLDLDLKASTLRRLAARYMEEVHVIYPFLIMGQLEVYLESVLRYLPDFHRKVQEHQQSSPGFEKHSGIKRNRSSIKTKQRDDTLGSNSRAVWLPRSLDLAIVLIVCALGSICEQRKRDREEMRDGETADTKHFQVEKNSNSCSGFSTIPPSSSSVLPSDLDYHRYSQFVQQTLAEDASVLGNPDMIPGLMYFAPATDIIGNHIGGHSPQHIHVFLLASLYYNQLVRPVESQAYIRLAGNALQVILRYELRNLEKFVSSPTKDRIPAKYNPLVFAFWTCLQLESDFVAEFEMAPQSGILEFENSMPWPDLGVLGGDLAIQSFSAQLLLTKHLNSIRRELYGSTQKSLQSKLSIIEELRENLQKISDIAPFPRLTDAETLSDKMLYAQLRGKFFGAQIMTYRQCLEVFLNHQDSEHLPREKLLPQIRKYAYDCIIALVNSARVCVSLFEIGLTVTNSWYLAHAQYGNVMLLIATSQNPTLKHTVKRDELMRIADRTITLLKIFGDPGSTLNVDLEYLTLAAHEAGILAR